MPLSWPYGVTGPVVGQMFHVKHWLWWRSCSGRRMARPWGRAASCARGRRPSCCCCLWSHGCSGRRRPRPPARLGNLAPLGAVPRSPPVPSGPSGALHTGGPCGSGVPGQAPPPPTGTAAVPVRVCKKSAAPAGLRTCVELRRDRNSLSGGRPSRCAWCRRAR